MVTIFFRYIEFFAQCFLGVAGFSPHGFSKIKNLQKTHPFLAVTIWHFSIFQKAFKKDPLDFS